MKNIPQAHDAINFQRSPITTSIKLGNSPIDFVHCTGDHTIAVSGQITYILGAFFPGTPRPMAKSNLLKALEKSRPRTFNSISEFDSAIGKIRFFAMRTNQQKKISFIEIDGVSHSASAYRNGLLVIGTNEGELRFFSFWPNSIHLILSLENEVRLLGTKNGLNARKVTRNVTSIISGGKPKS